MVHRLNEYSSEIHLENVKNFMAHTSDLTFDKSMQIGLI